MKFLILISLINLYQFQDDCCQGESWEICPKDCTQHKRIANRCCPLNQLCSAGGGCIKKNDVKKQLDDLEKEVSDQNCIFYDSLEQFFQCGEKGYPAGYGGKYCKEFLNQRESFEKKDWQDAVRQCLQQKMSDSLQKNYEEKGSIKCQEIKRMGFDSHVPCYLDTGKDLSFCKLPMKDKYEIFKIAMKDLVEAIPTGCVVFGKCLLGEHFKEQICTVGFQMPIDFSYKVKDKSVEIFQKIVEIFDYELQTNEKKMKFYFNSNQSAMITHEMSINYNDEKFIYNNRFIKFEGNKKYQKMKIFSDNEVNIPIISTDQIEDPLGIDQYDGIIGLGPKSVFIQSLYEQKEIKTQNFYMNEKNEMKFEKYQLKQNEQESYCDLTSTEYWQCDLKKIVIKNNEKQNELILDGFKYQFADGQNDNILILDSGLDILKNLLQSFIQEQQNQCMLIYQSSIYVTLLCNKDLDLTQIPNIQIQFKNFTIEMNSKNLFDFQDNYYKLKILVQLIQTDEKLILFGQKFLNNLTLVLNSQEQKIQFYGNIIVNQKSSYFWLYFFFIILIIILIILAYFYYQTNSKEDYLSVSDVQENIIQQIMNKNPFFCFFYFIQKLIGQITSLSIQSNHSRRKNQQKVPQQQFKEINNKFRNILNHFVLLYFIISFHKFLKKLINNIQNETIREK